MYSYCAVFLFRFINQNGNRRIQKERLSIERNNFHGNKTEHSSISKRKCEKFYMNEKSTGCHLNRLLVYASVIFFVLSRQSSNVYSWIPAGNGVLLICWLPSFSKRKAVRKMRKKMSKRCCAFRSCGCTSRAIDKSERAEDCLPDCSRRQGKDKEINEDKMKEGKKRKRRCSSNPRRADDSA